MHRIRNSGQTPPASRTRFQEMVIVIAIVVVLVVVGSLVADYQWRRWIAERKRNRE